MQPQFGEAVKRLKAEHGLSRNGLSYRTGIDRFTLADMEKGVVPRVEIVEQLARAFDLNPNEWRELAGYERLDLVVRGHIHAARDVDDSREAANYLNERLAEVEAEFGIDVSADLSGGTRGLTREKADQLVEAYRERLARRQTN